jgi:thymidylate kinase
VLDLPVAISRERVFNRDGGRADRMEREEPAFYERVRRGFLDLASRSARYHVLDATKPVEDLVAQAYARLAELVA